MSAVAENLQHVRERIRRAERRYGRAPGSVSLIAISKTRRADEIRAAASAGQRRFGESYVQEALEKLDRLSDLNLEWHFVGPIQSNKTKWIAERFDWVHSIDRVKIARRLSEQRPAHLPPLPCCLQVNVSGEASKSGVAPEAVAGLAAAVAALPGLSLRGLMTIPALDPEHPREPFRRLRHCLEALRGQGLELHTLSMGMTGDLEAAIAEGATMVRVGTGIFGPRPKG